MSTKKKIITIIIGAEVIIIAAVVIFLLYLNSDTVKVNRQLELAQRYLLEEDYEQAIAAFGIVIDIDPKNVDAYLGLAEAYVSADELQNAVRTLEKAAEQTDSGEVLEMLEVRTAEMGKRELAAQRAAEAAALASSAAAEAAALASSAAAEAAALEAVSMAETTNVAQSAAEVRTGSAEVAEDTPVFQNEVEPTETELAKIVTIEVLPQEESAPPNAPWKQAYIDFIRNRQNSTNNDLKYGLIYLDNSDDIPELVESDWIHVDIVSYYGGEVYVGGLDWCYGSFSYMDRQNMFVFDDDLLISYICHMEDGKVIRDVTGRYQFIYDEEGNWISSYHEWPDHRMWPEEYEQQYRMVKDMGTEWNVNNGYTADQILSIIASV